MVKVENLGMDLLYFQNSKTWDYGTYKILDSDIQNYGARKADGTLDESILERILYSHSNKALNQIKKDIDTKGILNLFTWSDLTGSRFIEALPLIMEAQLSGMITDGNKEIKKGSSYSGAGVDASIDASSFMLSHDRIYKAAEDVWFNYQLDKYDVEESEDEHGNKTYYLIDDADATVKQIVATIKLTPEQEQDIIDKTAQKIGSNSKFDLVNINGKDVIQPKAGRDLLLVDNGGNPIIPSSPNSAASVAVAEQKAHEASKNKADSFDERRLMSSTVTNDGVHIKKVNGYHSESSFNGGAFFGIAKDDYSVIASFKFLHDKANIRFRDAGGLMRDIPIQKIYEVANQGTLTPEQLAVLSGKVFTLEEKNYLDSLIRGGLYLGQIEVAHDATSDAIINAIKTKFPNANAGDHIEVVKPAFELNTTTYITYTAATVMGSITWNAGVESKVPLKSGAVDTYTTSEIDDKLNHKQASLTDAQKAIINSNAFTDAEKAKLAKALTTHQDISGKANVGDSYTKVESDARYEPLTTFFTPSVSHQAGYIIINETGIKDVAIGTQIKMDLKYIDTLTGTPSTIPGDSDRLIIGITGQIWQGGIQNYIEYVNKTNTTDVNVKDNYASKYFVLKKISATRYDFVRFEDKPQPPVAGGGGHWETIDPVSYAFTEPTKFRIHIRNDVATGQLQKWHNHYQFMISMGIVHNKEYLYSWASNKTDKSHLDQIIRDYDVVPTTTTIDASLLPITKFEIWRED